MVHSKSGLGYSRGSFRTPNFKDAGDSEELPMTSSQYLLVRKHLASKHWLDRPMARMYSSYFPEEACWKILNDGLKDNCLGSHQSRQGAWQMANG